MKEFLTAEDIPVINKILESGNDVRIERFYDGIKVCQQNTKPIIQRLGSTERNGIPVAYRRR